MTMGMSFGLNAQISVLSEGKWMKMRFESNGVYRIDYNTLNDMGFDPSSLDPQNLAIYGLAGGMLPQANSVERPDDLVENLIFVEGESDGDFSTDDYILFYVDSPHKISFDETHDTYSFEKNLYSDYIYYFLTLKNQAGLRISPSANLITTSTPLDWYRKIESLHIDENNLLSSGRQWFGKRLAQGSSDLFEFENQKIAQHQSIKIEVSAAAQSFNSSSLLAELNGSPLGTLNFQSIPNTQYGIKANIQISVFQISSNDLTNLDLSLTYNRNGQNNAVCFLDYVTLDIPSNLELGEEPILLRNPSMTENTISAFKLETGNEPIRVWNVTDPLRVLEQEFEMESDAAIFGTFTHSPQEFYVFSNEQIQTVEVYEEAINQDIKSLLNTEFIIITHPDFFNEAERLAEFRKSNDQLRSAVVTVNQVYNEFSSGRQDLTAIRDFIRYSFQNGSLQYVLFFGKGSYDYLNRTEDNTNYVPTYESRNSIHPLLTYSSDDYFGFLDDNEGEWIESISGDHLLDVGIGRIPVTTVDQAKTVVDKLIRYETDPRSMGDWRNKLIFIADDGDRNIHQRDADILATLVDTTYTQFQVDKLYLDQFKQVQLPNGERSEDAQQQLLNSVNDGALMINFTGHGAEFAWMQEQILTFDLMDQWNNPFKLPFLITATCEFGRNDDPNIFSGAEHLLFKKDGGSIGLVTTARPVFSSTNFRLNQALYEIVLEQQNDDYFRLGDIIRHTKNNSLQGSLNRNFILLGDPSMTLNYPDLKIEFNEINDSPLTENDTIRAFQKVKLNGHISQNGQPQPSFNGEGIVTVFDKNVSKTTLGDENDPFNYNLRETELFKGVISVKDGQFETEFIVPRNIDYSFGHAKISIYAQGENGRMDASGSLSNLTLGGSDIPLNDDNGPSIKVFLEDTTRQISGIYPDQVLVILKLNDESGINISDLGFGQDIRMVLNDSIEFILNKEYQSDLDSFTNGTVSLWLDDLASGLNHLYIEAWDNAGNFNSIVQEFTVQENTSYITEINNHPNPFDNRTLFHIEHLLENENLELTIDVYDRNGVKVASLNQEYLRAGSVLTLSWNAVSGRGQKLTNGIYIYTTKIQSKTSGKSAIQRKKLIISN